MTLSKYAVVCAACHIEMRVEENGLPVIELAGRPPKAYKLYRGDLYVCPICDAQAVNGLTGPVEDFEKDFHERIAEALEGEHAFAHEYETDACDGLALEECIKCDQSIIICSCPQPTLPGEPCGSCGHSVCTCEHIEPGWR